MSNAILDYVDLVERPEFQDLPYKVETTAGGQIIMSPHLNIHSAFQRAIERKLETLMEEPGVALQEFAIQTEDGVKVPDVAWVTPEQLKQAKEIRITSEAPKICVEVKSKGNTTSEIDAKAQLYFAQGAEEVWACDLEGQMRFQIRNLGYRSRSQRCPNFPTTLDPFVI